MNSRAVLVTALRSELGVSGDHDGLLVADIRHPDAVESLLGSIHADGEVPLVTCPAADYEAVRRLVTFASVRYPGLRAILEPLPGAPLCFGVISSLVDDITADSSTPGPDVLAWRLAALDLLREQVWSAVWLPTVSGLAEPPPRLTQHIRSWFPGSGFLAVHTPDPVVLSAPRAPIAGLEERPDSALIHTRSKKAAWVVDAVRDATSPVSVSELATVRGPVDTFGTSSAVELVSVPLAFHSRSRPDARDIRVCPACNLRHSRSICPLCRMSATPAPLMPSGAAS